MQKVEKKRRGGFFTPDRNGSTGIGKLVKYIFLIIIAIVSVYPFLWMVCSSFKTDGDIIAAPVTLITSNMNVEGYTEIMRRIPFVTLYRNTIIFAGTVTVCGLFFGSLAGYAYSKLNFKGRNVLFTICLSSMMIPFQVTMIPLFIEIKMLGLYNTMGALILPRLCGMFEVFMMRNFFMGLPGELQEAARIDGCNEFRIYWNIMLPLCKPAFLSCGLFIFNSNWNDLLFPMVMINDENMRTLQSGLMMLMGTYVQEYSIMMAGSVLGVMPLLIIYMFLQKYFIQGIAMSGLKG